MLMLIVHILFAIVGLVGSTLLLFKPNYTLFKFSAFIASGTLVTGLVLIAVTPMHIVSTCLTGIVYFGFVGYSLVHSYRKLATVNQKV